MDATDEEDKEGNALGLMFQETIISGSDESSTAEDSKVAYYQSWSSTIILTQLAATSLRRTYKHATKQTCRTENAEEAESEIQKAPAVQQQPNKQDNLPAYCNPPNPCPVGYTAEEGCLEEFENTAAFSREYQARQDCMCDSEHMFDCTNNHNGNDISQSDLDQLVRQFHVEDEHKTLVAKKFHIKKVGDYQMYLQYGNQGCHIRDFV